MKHISLSDARLAIPSAMNSHESAVVMQKNKPIGVVIPYEDHASYLAVSSLVNNKMLDIALQSHTRALAGDFSHTKGIDSLELLADEIASNQGIKPNIKVEQGGG